MRTALRSSRRRQHARQRCSNLGLRHHHGSLSGDHARHVISRHLHTSERRRMSHTAKVQFRYLQSEKKLAVRFSYQPAPYGSVYWTRERLLSQETVEAMLDAFPTSNAEKWIEYNVEQQGA